MIDPKILIVDDEEKNVKLLKAILRIEAHLLQNGGGGPWGGIWVESAVLGQGCAFRIELPVHP